MDEIPDELKNEIFMKAFEQAEIANYTKDEYNAYIASLDYYWCNYADLDTARKEGRDEQLKIQEEKIKQIEERHSKEIQGKDSVIHEKDSVIQEKENKLKQVALELLKSGMSKEQVIKITGIEL